MLIKPRRKHSRLQTREARLRHEARVARLAQLWGMDKTWASYWGKRRTDRKPCSCPMCGNERRWFGTKPIQWQRLDLHDAEDRDD